MPREITVRGRQMSPNILTLMRLLKMHLALDHSNCPIRPASATWLRANVKRLLIPYHSWLHHQSRHYRGTELHRNPAIKAILAGGVMRHINRGIVAPGTVERNLHFPIDTAAIGTSTINADGTLLDFDIQEIQVS